MRDLINSFITSMKADGKSKCTVSAYKGDLNDFLTYADTYIQKNVDNIKYSDLREWVNHLEESGLAATSRARKISSVKSFFRYLSKMDYITGKNPADNLDSPKLTKKQPKVISSDDAKNLLDCTKEHKCDSSNTLTTFRDYAVLATFLFTGVRREELSNIMLSDVNMDNGTILIHGKGNKERTVYINDTLQAILSEYMLVYRGKFKTAEESKYLFPSIKNDKMALKTINNIVNKSMDAAGIKEQGVSAHVLRKRFATTVFDRTQDIATTSELLGHSSPTVTMRYVSINENIKRKAVSTVNF